MLQAVLKTYVLLTVENHILQQNALGHYSSWEGKHTTNLNLQILVIN